jgi:inosine-uridine nucleoside N-ribohydrolase
VILRAIAPELFRAETMRLNVETGDTDAGATMIDPDGGEVEVLLGVDAAQALALVTGRLDRGYKEVQS